MQNHHMSWQWHEKQGQGRQNCKSKWASKDKETRCACSPNNFMQNKCSFMDKMKDKQQCKWDETGQVSRVHKICYQNKWTFRLLLQCILQNYWYQIGNQDSNTNQSKRNFHRLGWQKVWTSSIPRSLSITLWRWMCHTTNPIIIAFNKGKV